MNSKTYFQESKNNIGYVGSNFKEHFMDMEFTIPKKLALKTRKLERDMTDKEILNEFKPHESNLGELAYALENNLLDKENYNSNIFYIKDKKGVLWAVRAHWNSDYRAWYVDAYSVEFPLEWLAGSQVISCDCGIFDSLKPNDPLKLGNSEPVKITEIEYLGNRYRLVEN